MVKYTKEEINAFCENAIKDVSTFYKQKFVNNIGKTSDTKEYYSEVISEFLCNNLDQFESIPCITRESTYNMCHNGIFVKTNRCEEDIAMQMFIQCKKGYKFDRIGKIIDYQTPLKNNRYDGVGKIDLLSVSGKTIFILELKSVSSYDTMLKCVLEGYTYLKTVNFTKLKKDFELTDIEYIKSSPLVFKDERQWQEMQENRPHLKRLMELLDSVPYYLAVKYETTDN